MYATREGSRRLPEDYKLGKFEDGFILPKEEFSESLIHPLSIVFFAVYAAGSTSVLEELAAFCPIPLFCGGHITSTWRLVDKNGTLTTREGAWLVYA
jgi:hypothetical protein